MPFDRKTTCEVNVPRAEKSNHKVRVSTPDSGLEKRQCPFQVSFSPVQDKLRIEIIFRGTGKRISEDEKAAYHEGVDVYWQTNAWADTNVSVQWVKRTLAPAIQDFDEFILFCDNHEAQTSTQFKEEVRKLGGIVCYGVPNARDLWQPVDGGYGQLLKKLVATEQQKWLECDENIDKWSGNSEVKLDSKERRTLITHWVGEAFKRLQSSDCDKSSYRCFERTGCLITADGSDDGLINPEGHVRYFRIKN